MSLRETKLPDVKLFKRGKVRDIYELDNYLLLVSTDRISAFDYVLSSLIPCKGKVLNQISIFWFDFFKNQVNNHLINNSFENFPKRLKKYENQIKDRSVIVQKLKPIQYEIIVRGYITGSGWKSYKQSGKISGIKLPEGLKESEKFEKPLFTPTTKAEKGHDLPVTIEDLNRNLGEEITSKLKNTAITLYKKASEYALERGIIIADTKFEFAFDQEDLILIDEVLSPDSSRFWPLENYEPGKPQKSFDKQFVRNYLLNSSWDRKSTPPPLPEKVVKKTSLLYKQIYKLLTKKNINC